MQGRLISHVVVEADASLSSQPFLACNQLNCSATSRNPGGRTGRPMGTW